MANVRNLQQQVDALSAEYGARFAGHARATRDPADLESIIARLRGLKAQADGLAGASRDPNVKSLKDVINSNLALYEKEKKEIQAARSAGPNIVRLAQLGTAANFVFARYTRHFAGKNRATRDLALLVEMIDELTAVRDEMRDLVSKTKDNGAQEDLKLVEENLKMYTAERGLITDGRDSGTNEERAGTLAELANGQFKIYEHLFAGKSRTSRRPQLLVRVIESLEQIKTRMETLQSLGSVGEYNANNIKIVTDNLAMYRRELAEIRSAREAAKVDDLVGALGQAANEVMDEYDRNFAGQDRRTRDLDLLTRLADALGELQRQMADIDRATDNDTNAKNLLITTDNLTMLDREYQAIDDAKNGRTPAPPANNPRVN